MKILFCRHGESLANTLHIISNRDLPHGLTAQGQEQARTLAGKLAEIGGIRAIYASPVPRANETARIVAARLGNMQVITHPGLAEYDCGELEGRGDEESWRRHNRFFHDWLENKRRAEFPQGGESFTQIRDRLARFVNEILEKHSGPGHVLCVSHGGTLRLGLPVLLRNIDYNFTSGHGLGHVELIEAGIRSGELVCLAWGDQRLES